MNTAGVVQWSYARGGEIARALRYSPNLQAPWASVSSPNGSEVWEAGSSHNITWLDFDNFGVTSFKLDYSTDSGSSWLPIQDWIDGEPRTFAWTIPNTPSSSCKVKVYCRDIAGNIGTDSSNSNFTINSSDTEAPSVIVGSPNGGEDWQVGSAHSISWSDYDNIGIASFKLEYSTDSGSNWITIQDWLSGDPHTFLWTVPNTQSTQCKIKISCRDASSNIGEDVSNSNFTISFIDTEAPSVTLSIPNGGEVWDVGSSHNITWSDNDNVGITSYKLEYSTNSGSDWTTIQEWVSSDPHTYSWVVPNAPSALCRVRVSCLDAASNIGMDQSNGDFTIIQVIPPGTISGHVYEQDGITPLSSVIVGTYDNLNALVAVDTSTAAGDYQVSLPPATYHEHFAKGGYTSSDISGILVASDSISLVSISLNQIVGGCTYVIGDANGSATFTGLDVTYSVRYFKGGSHPLYSCECPVGGGNTWYVSGDVNGSCTFSGLDVTYMVRYFKGGAAPICCSGCPPTMTILGDLSQPILEQLK
ncbi:MAG TPA: hypothetical protein DCZ43_06770 [candidate division Zixibacteria bacterium]|nr:hypothetical protein [candidate division Zixibacteria bacterium]